jgi:predicted outer membrane protein
MLSTLVVLLVASGQGTDQTTLPRQADTQPYQKRDESQGVPTDPLFDRKLDATFIVTAIENSRQSTLDAEGAAETLGNLSLRETAQAIGAQNKATTQKLESLAKRKGWRLPEQNPGRASTLPTASPARASANFIKNQITAHETTLAQFRAQIAGKGDPELKRTLKQALPGYEKNLTRLLEARP